MRQGFTLIELLVVMVIMVVVMGVVMPQGSKMLDSFQKQLEKKKASQEIQKQKSISFLQAKEQTIKLLGKTFIISNKGVLHESSNDNN